MKKYITIIPLQPEGQLKSSVYTAVGNDKLEYGETSFPVIPLINGYTCKDDEIEVIAIKHKYSNSDINYEIFKDQLQRLADEKGFKYKINLIEIPYDNRVSVHVKSFERIAETINDGDIVGGCITFGSKPLSQIVMMTINYAIRARKKCSLSAIVYGEFDHISQQSSIYDVSSLFYVDEIVMKSAGIENSDPLKLIRFINEED